ncbi:cation-transporting P-type ATPase, partial [Actinoplanes campanulatus]
MTAPARTAGSAVRGLSDVEAAARLAADGPNLVAPPRRHGVSYRVGRQLADPLVALLLVAGL